MDAKPAYFSLIQYCPDPGRLEAANVGVLLFCPAANFLDAHIAWSNDRVRKFFGRQSFDTWALTQAKRALVARLKVEREEFRTLEDLVKFIQTRANDIVLSPPRPAKVWTPQEDLERLFQELVGKQRTPAQRKVMVPELDAVFQELEHEGRAALNVPVKIPLLGKRVRIPYAYRNGAVHLVKPERFPPVEGQATDAAMKLAIEGDLLERYGRDADGEKRLVVVSTFAGETPNPDVRERVVRVLKEYHVKTVLPSDLAAFVEEVRRKAH